MGCVIYYNSELRCSELSEEQMEHIANIKDGYGESYAFEIDSENGFHFAGEGAESGSPVDTYIETPLKEVLEYAKEQGITINGEVAIQSDWNDYDNIQIDIEDNELSYVNMEVRNASTEELLNELKHRGLELVDAKQLREQNNALLIGQSMAEFIEQHREKEQKLNNDDREDI